MVGKIGILLPRPTQFVSVELIARWKSLVCIPFYATFLTKWTRFLLLQVADYFHKWFASVLFLVV